MSPRRREGAQLDLFGTCVAPLDLADEARAVAPLAARLPLEVRLGTSSWSFPGWRDVWSREVTERQLVREGLAIYARHPLFRTVGIDRTHYAPVSRMQFEAWAADVPDSFRFLVKAHDHLTLPHFPQHPRYGRHKGEQNARYLDPSYARDAVIAPVVGGLGAKAGPILFQFAPQGRGIADDAPRFAEALHGFLAALPRGPLYAVELRDPKLLSSAYVDALADVSAVHCLSVQTGMTPLAKQLLVARPRAPAVVVRWMLGAGLRYEEALARYAPFTALVDEDRSTRASVAAIAAEAIGARLPIWIIANNKAEGCAPATLQKLAAAIADAAG